MEGDILTIACTVLVLIMVTAIGVILSNQLRRNQDSLDAIEAYVSYIPLVGEQHHE